MKPETKYKKMTRAERRVAIAKDVIKLVNSERSPRIASGESYCKYLDGFYFPSGFIDKEVANDVMPECTVCARGAMMLCRIAKYNGVEVDVRGAGVLREDTAEVLEDAFSEFALGKIEFAFEYGWFASGEITGVSGIVDDADRLIAIMQNIIDHKGTFKPNVQYEMKTI